MVRRGQDRNVCLLGLRCDAHSKNDYLLTLKRDLVQISAPRRNLDKGPLVPEAHIFKVKAPRDKGCEIGKGSLVFHKKDDLACALDQRLVTTLSMSK